MRGTDDLSRNFCICFKIVGKLWEQKDFEGNARSHINEEETAGGILLNNK